MKNRHKVKYRYMIVFVIVIIAILIAVLSNILSKNKQLNIIESVAKDTVVGIQRVVYYPLKEIQNLLSDFKKLNNVLDENDILKKNVDKIDRLEAENIELKKEIDSLKKELNVDFVLTDYTFLNATVISRNTGYWYNVLTIDKGKHNGIQPGMVVVNSSGLIGKIISVSEFSSDVKLITTTDTNNKISVTVYNGNNKVTGLINGYDYDKEVLEVEGISNTENVEVGDLVYTSGLGGVFPAGIIIGKVESITTDVYDLAKIINVKPSANFDDINFVSVLKRDDDKDGN